LSTENNGDWFKIVSKEVDEEVLNSFDVNFHLFTGSAGVFEVFVSYSKGDSGGLTKTEFKFRVMNLIEFVESGTNAGFQEGEDTVVQTFTFNGAWNNFVGPTDLPSNANGRLQTFSANTTDGFFRLESYVTEVLANLNFSAISELKPNQIKMNFDVDFTNYYQQTGTYLAIQGRIKSGRRISGAEDGTWETEEVSIAGEDGASSSFSWVSSAETAQGQTIDIIPSALTYVETDDEDWAEYKIYFTFDTTEHTKFFWDPIVAVSGAQNIIAPIAMILLAILALFA